MTGPGSVVEVVRVAHDALGAVATVVVDTRAEPTVVARAGRCAHELRRVLEASAAEPPSWSRGRYRGRSFRLPDAEGRPVGVVHVAWTPDGAASRDDASDAVLRAFARHLGLALGWQDRPDLHPAQDRLPWDDAARLPDAIREITGQVTEIVRPVTGARAVGITAWDPERRVLRALPGAFGSEDDTLAASVTGPVTNMRSVGSRVFASGAPYLSNDAGADPGVLQPYAEVFRIGRMLSVPLDGPGRRVGVLHLANKPTDFTVDDLAAVTALAPRLATAVDLAGAVERMAAQQRLEAVLTDTAVAVATGSSVRECLQPAFDRLGEELEASVVALVPLGSAPLVRRIGPQAGDELEDRLLRDARDAVTTSSGAFPRRVGDPGWAALHAPVELDGERTATLAILRRTGQPFTGQEEDVVTRLARLVALAWTTERYQRQLAEIARLRERERIADGLHDRVAQLFFAAGLGIDSALEARSLDEQRLVEVRDLLVHGDGIVRDVIHQLDVGAAASPARRLRREVEAVEDEFGVVVHLDLPPDDDLSGVRRPVADAAVKVAREGVVNAAKHAGPCRVGLVVSIDGAELVVEVSDDGLGARAAGSDRPSHGVGSVRRAVDDTGGSLVHGAGDGGFGHRLLARFPL